MVDIQFDNEQEFAPLQINTEKEGLITLVQKWGFANNSKAAQTILVIVVGLALFIAFFISLFAGPSPSKPIIRPDIPISAPTLNT